MEPKLIKENLWNGLVPFDPHIWLHKAGGMINFVFEIARKSYHYEQDLKELW